MRTYGHAGPLVTATTGIQIPLAPRALTVAEAEARAQRQVAAIEAAESAPAPVAPARPSRRYPVRTSPVPGTTTPPAPPAPPVAAAGPVPCTVCGIAVAPDYLARTGEARHRCCKPQPAKTGQLEVAA